MKKRKPEVNTHASGCIVRDNQTTIRCIKKYLNTFKKNLQFRCTAIIWDANIRASVTHHPPTLEDMSVAHDSAKFNANSFCPNE